ncbi:MAG: PH domain-containing protein [Candidatus Micrarchaeia archaeon]
MIRELERRSLSKRARLIWGAKGMLTIAVLAVLLSFALSQTPGALSYVLACALAAFLGYIAYIELRFRNFYYALTDSEVVIRHGILRTESTVIPYVKIQNISIYRSLAQRILGSAAIKVETAEKQEGDHNVIPAVTDYKALVEEILERKENALGKGGAESV